MGSHSFKDLIRHVGHKISVVVYGSINSEEGDAGMGRMYDIDNVAIECEDCHEALLDFDKIKNTEQEVEEFEESMMTYFVECDDKKQLTHWLCLIQGELDRKFDK